MNFSYYETRINTSTAVRYDLTPIFADPEMAAHLLTDLLEPFSKIAIDKVVALDASGFIVGAPIAHKLGVGFVPVRKAGKLPTKDEEKLQTSYVDYSKTKKTLEMNKGALQPGEKVLLVDDWIETGAGARAAITLIEQAGAEVVGITTIGAERNDATEILFTKYNCHAIKVF